MPGRPDALYKQLAEQLLNRIRSGEWPIGARIPSRRELAQASGHREATVQRAIELLEQEGVLGGRKGSGVRVIGDPDKPGQWLIRPGLLTGTFPKASRPTYEHSTGTGQADERIARRLGLRPGAPVMVTSYEVMYDLRPVYYAHSWEPLELTRNTEITFPEDGRWAGRGVAARMERIGVQVSRVEEDPYPREATPEEAHILGLRPTELVFEIARTHFGVVAGAERPVETADIIVSAERYRLRYRISL